MTWNCATPAEGVALSCAEKRRILHLHARVDRRSAGPGKGGLDRAGRRRISARTAAGRWCSRRAASAPSSPAPATPIARPPSRSAARRRSPTCRWTRSARSAATTWCMKSGRFGEFTACSNYPTCKYVKQKTIGVKCPECSRGRGHRAPFEEGQDVLRLQSLSRLQVRRVGQAGAGEVPGMRQPVHDREIGSRPAPFWQCPNAECKHKVEVPVVVAS